MCDNQDPTVTPAQRTLLIYDTTTREYQQVTRNLLNLLRHLQLTKYTPTPLQMLLWAGVVIVGTGVFLL